jgi:hypothetical protein
MTLCLFAAVAGVQSALPGANATDLLVCLVFSFGNLVDFPFLFTPP